MRERFGRAETVEDPEIPDDGEHIWTWFWMLAARRQSGINGPQPISYADIMAWCQMTGELMLREELAIIIRMDDSYLSSISKIRDEQAEANKAK